MHEELATRLAKASVVMLLGAIDTGKTTLARKILAAGVAAGRSCAYVDADIGNSTVGPPACVGVRYASTRDDLSDLETPDQLHFVGAISPNRLVLQQVMATASGVALAKERADLVVIDTTGVTTGVAGETLKYHKMEICRPDEVVALQRGAELEPLVGMLRRFFSVEATMAAADPDVAPTSPDERAAQRAARFKEAFAPPLERWRVRPTVFAPTLPSGLDLERLSGMLVGIHDGEGSCRGLGRLEYKEDKLLVETNVPEGMQGLRLGSLRLDLDTYDAKPVNLREVIFGI